jgi:hypothetical protein
VPGDGGQVIDSVKRVRASGEPSALCVSLP